MNPDAPNSADLAQISGHLHRMAPRLPGNIRHRLLNCLENFDRARVLLAIDREMASFRAITGQEEAATALMLAVQLRRYAGSKKFNPWSHQHKAAVMVCVAAVRNEIVLLLKNFQLTFNFDKRRVDMKIPLSNFNVEGGEEFWLQPSEPLDLLHTKEGRTGAQLFAGALANLASHSQFTDIKKLVAAQANSRNGLLYASDAALPKSKVTAEGIEQRQWSSVAMLVLAIMVLQSRKHMALVRDTLPAFLGVISHLPSET